MPSRVASARAHHESHQSCLASRPAASGWPAWALACLPKAPRPGGSAAQAAAACSRRGQSSAFVSGSSKRVGHFHERLGCSSGAS
eukprot:15454873-Alexandrium_andersonii.AAC.1